MGVDKCSILVVGLTTLTIVVSIYIGWPCPPFSHRLREWKSKDSSYFKLKNQKMFYKDVAGEDQLVSSSTVLLLHGFPTMSMDWIKILPTLRKQFKRVIAVDFLGFGFSDKPVSHNYTIVGQADLVSALLRALKIAEVHLLSHDYGDSVAQELLARQNNEELSTRIKSACLLNGGMFKETNFPRPMQHMLVKSPFIGRIISRLSNRHIFSAQLSNIFGLETKPMEEDLYDFWCGFSTNHGYVNSADILSYIEERSRNNIRWREALAKSVVPIHVIYGPADPVNPPGFINFYREVVEKGTIDVLADTIGHYPQWEDSDNVASLYIKFIKTALNVAEQPAA